MSECINWKGSKSKGYGTVWFNGKHHRAHRLSFCSHYRLSLADIEGMVIMHKCDNPSCVNPEHLLAGTQEENNKDRDLKGRQRNGAHVLRGENHYIAKLTNYQAECIRKEYVSMSRTHGTRALAKKYGVGQQTISKIVRSKTYCQKIFDIE